MDEEVSELAYECEIRATKLKEISEEEYFARQEEEKI
jgi:hypothetical protein